MFLTGPEFLPELREQRKRTLQLVAEAETRGQQRVVEMNRQVLTNLDVMIGKVQEDATDESDQADDGSEGTDDAR